MPAVLPSGLEAFVDHVVPILQQRGLFRTEYTGTTLRDHYSLPRPSRQTGSSQSSIVAGAQPHDAGSWFPGRGAPARQRIARRARVVLMGKRPSVVAHRGASDVSPEHTLAAYSRAVESGADGLECDVRLTADGHLVCVHDRRIDRTSNGRGVLSTMSLEELRQPSTGGRGRTRGPSWTTKPSCPTRTCQGAHAGVAAGDGPRRRPAARAGDRDEAPDPVRRAGGAPADRDAGPVRLGAPEDRLGVAGPGDELLLAVAAPDADDGAGPADGAADGPGAAAVPRRLAADRRLATPVRAWRSSPHTPSTSTARTNTGTRCTSGRSNSEDEVRHCRGHRRRRDHQRPPRAGPRTLAEPAPATSTPRPKPPRSTLLRRHRRPA